MIIAPARISLLFGMLAMASRSICAFRAKKSALRLPKQRCSSSSSEDLPIPDPPPQEYPRAAVAIALRYFGGDPNDPQAHYLFIRRGNEPNKGKWSLPGGKLDWGETTLEGAKRELDEEIAFDFDEDDASDIVWCSEPYATADSITDGFHYLIAVCFAEWKPNETKDNLQPPKVTACDDAIDAKWWSMDEILTMGDGTLLGTPGFVKRMKRTEFLYQQGVLICDEEQNRSMI